MRLFPALLLLAGCATGVGDYLPEGHASAEPVRVFFLGDSITDGTINGVAVEDDEDVDEEPDEDADDVEDYGLWSDLIQVNDDARFPDAAGETLSAAFPTIEEVHNLAVGGAVAADVAGEQLDRMLQIADGRPGRTLVLVTVGGNDMNDGDPAPGNGRRIGRTVNGRLAALQATLSDPARFPDGARLYAANLYDPSGPGLDGAACFEPLLMGAMGPEIQAFNRVIGAGAQDAGYAMLDLWSLFWEHGYGNDSPEEADAGDPEATMWFSDCIHPNARGHHEIRRLFLDALRSES